MHMCPLAGVQMPSMQRSKGLDQRPFKRCPKAPQFLALHGAHLLPASHSHTRLEPVTAPALRSPLQRPYLLSCTTPPPAARGAFCDGTRSHTLLLKISCPQQSSARSTRDASLGPALNSALGPQLLLLLLVLQTLLQIRKSAKQIPVPALQGLGVGKACCPIVWVSAQLFLAQQSPGYLITS